MTALTQRGRLPTGTTTPCAALAYDSQPPLEKPKVQPPHWSTRTSSATPHLVLQTRNRSPNANARPCPSLLYQPTFHIRLY